MFDVWGDIYRTELSGRPAAHVIERDDGYLDHFASASSYFDSPEQRPERDLLDRLQGPVLDLAAGAGSHSLYLQDSAGLDVTAAEYSPGARAVCLARGCRRVVEADLRQLDLPSSAYGSIIVMGNTIGAHQTPDSFVGFLRRLRDAVRPGGCLLFTMIDPLDTVDERHLGYQRSNVAAGRPPGLVRIRMWRGDRHDDWMYLWMLTEPELRHSLAESEWTEVGSRRAGPLRVILCEKVSG
ncbi:MAG: class I SAM-dependent methyltransferase [Candidatus Eisenbacteria bacterium]